MTLIIIIRYVGLLLVFKLIFFISFSRQIETDHDGETQELQNCWTELRKLVRMLYGRREGDLYEEDTNVPDDESAQDLVHRLPFSPHFTLPIV